MRYPLLEIQVVVIIGANLCVCKIPGTRQPFFSFRHFRLPPSVGNADQASRHVVPYSCPSLAVPLARRDLNPLTSRDPDHDGIVRMQKNLRFGVAGGEWV